MTKPKPGNTFDNVSDALDKVLRFIAAKAAQEDAEMFIEEMMGRRSSSVFIPFKVEIEVLLSHMEEPLAEGYVSERLNP